MFAPPKELPTVVHTRVPDRLRLPNRQTDWTRARPQYKVDSFLEGPCFDRNGNLYVVNIAFGQIFRITPDCEWSIAEYDGEPNGLAIHRDGRIFVADSKRGIVVVDASTGGVEPLVCEYLGKPFKGCNDLVFARNGDLYFTDQGQTGLNDPTGRLFRYTTAGRLECLLDNVPSPNGLVLSPDESMLFLAVTRGNCVWRVPFMPDGTVNRVGLYVQLSGSHGGPDGMAIDAAGALCVAHVYMGCVWVFDTWGEPLYRIRSCTGGRKVTNVAYGGPGNRSLFITEADTGVILRADLETEGMTLFSHL